MGPADSGKSYLLELLAGTQNPPAGAINATSPRVLCADPQFNKKATPLSVATAGSKERTARIFEVLNALNLTDVRDRPIAKLSQSQVVACILIPGLSLDSGITLIDGLLDLLDPWILKSVLRFIDDDLLNGKTVFVTTHQPQIAERCHQVIVLSNLNPVFAGTVPQLIALAEPTKFTVECTDGTSVAAMVEPFSLHVKKLPGRVEFTSHRDQSVAAKLLTHGYGNVTAVTVESATLEQALTMLRG
jgi:ABC-type multidrug transport system ATPase subunit